MRELKRLSDVLRPLHTKTMPASRAAATRQSGQLAAQAFECPLVRPEVVVEVTYLTWTDDNLLRQVSYQGQREDKPAGQVVRKIPHSAA